MAKLTPESPRLFRPTLAAWIGLNESIFLEQLNFIITETDKGKFADGKKWYRDTPRAFMVTYFPFWDESIVKRTIANLRADALILVRSDLNEDHRDRSLWYTINYPSLERLDGPVARITGKSEKRKEARKARKTKPDNYPDYAKVQNVPLSDEAGTNSTSDNQQNVLLPSVQIVPTPKESLILEDQKTKESGDKSPAPLKPQPIPKAERPNAIPGVTVFVEVTKRHVLNNTQIKEIDERVGRDPPALDKWREVVKAWQLHGNKINNISGMLDWFKKGIPVYAQKASTKNGHYSPSQDDPRPDSPRQTGGLSETSAALGAAWLNKRRGRGNTT